MNATRDDELPSATTRRRLLVLQRLFFTFAIALSIIFAGGVLRAGLYHVIDERAFENDVRESARPGGPGGPVEARTAAGTASHPRLGPLARLEIPRVGLSVIVRDGTDEWTLNRGAGHIPGTSYPGSDGNIGIAGHRDGYFRALRKVQHDDEVLLTGTDGGVTRYRVRQTRIVAPDDVSVLDRSAGPSVTLVTCYPFGYIGSAPKRYVLTARRIDDEPKVRTAPTS